MMEKRRVAFVGMILPPKAKNFFCTFGAKSTRKKLFFILTAFRWRKAAKATRPIPMSASGRLKAASGDYSRVCKQTVPAAVAFSPPSAFSPSEPSRESPCGVKNKAHVAEMYLSYHILCRQRRHLQSALSFDAEKEGASCGASATGWRIGLILRAPCSAAARTIPRKTTCGGFWYFWPQKYKKEKKFVGTATSRKPRKLSA